MIKNPINNTGTYLFFALVITNILITSIAWPNWVFGGEMWAEMATNYYRNSLSHDIRIAFFSTDYGYYSIPQRAISFLTTLLNTPKAYVPYIYTWSALVISSCLVGSFCLDYYSTVIKNPFLRLVSCFMVLWLVDFETRTFINFTYFSAFFISITVAAMMRHPKTSVPMIAKYLPLFIISKPAILITLPALLVAIIKSKSRILIFTLGLAFIQVIRLLYSLYEGGGNGQPLELTPYLLVDTGIYFLGFMGQWLMGPDISNFIGFNWIKIVSVAMGASFFLTTSFLIFKFQIKKELPLILTGLSVLICGIVFNQITAPVDYNNLTIPIRYFNLGGRQTSVLFFGWVLIFISFVSIVSRHSLLSRHILAGPAALMTYLFLAGYMHLMVQLFDEPKVTTLNIGQWQNQTQETQPIRNEICIPINPLGWAYLENCNRLNENIHWGTKFIFNRELPKGEYLHLDLKRFSLKENAGSNLLSLGVLIKPETNIDQKTPISGRLIIETKDEKYIDMLSTQNILDSGGLLYFTFDAAPISEISTIKINFSHSIYIATTTESTPIAIFFGR
jgi:hypothetical protein